MDDGFRRGYRPPGVVDYGRLTEMTTTSDLIFGTALGPDRRDLSFSGTGQVSGSTGSSPASSSSAATAAAGGDSGLVSDGPVEVAATDAGASDAAGAAAGQAGGGAGGGGGGGGHAGGTLPFTGFVAAVPALIGSAAVGLGAVLRRASRRKPAPGRPRP